MAWKIKVNRRTKTRYYSITNKLRRENSVLTKRVKELTRELKQYSSLKENILKLQSV